MNKVIISGNLGADPETRTTQSGAVIGHFRVATKERVKKGEEWVDHTEWFSVTVFGKQAENAQKYLQKGSGVIVVGKLRTEEWTDKDGVKRYTTKVVADDVEYTSRGKGAEDRQEERPATKSKSGGGSAKHSAPNDDDSIPF